jgi:hypothetical protein
MPAERVIASFTESNRLSRPAIPPQYLQLMGSHRFCLPALSVVTGPGQRRQQSSPRNCETDLRHSTPGNRRLKSGIPVKGAVIAGSITLAKRPSRRSASSNTGQSPLARSGSCNVQRNVTANTLRHRGRAHLEQRLLEQCFCELVAIEANYAEGMSDFDAKFTQAIDHFI